MKSVDGNTVPPADSPVTECAQMELQDLRLKVMRLERDNRMLALMNENAEKMRIHYEAEKSLHYLYNDLLLSNCPNMIFLFNEQLCLAICSESCCPLLSTKNRQDLAGSPLNKVFGPSVAAGWVEKIRQQHLEAFRERSSMNYDDTLVLDGETLNVQVMIAAIIDTAGRCCGTIMTINDVTEFVQTKCRAEEASRSKSSFLANMSHEIRTPMNAVKGLSELLALTELNVLQRNYVSNIVSSANSLLGILNDVLDFSKIDANKLEFIEGPYDLADLIASVSNVVSLRANDKHLLMLIDTPPDLPKTLYGDDVRVKQIIINLLSNAVKYTHAGYVELSLHVESRTDAVRLVCSVKDTGIGIRKDDLGKLFDAFSRVDLISNRSIKGTGLGLAISQQLALAMGGTIRVESEYGGGSVFTLEIPQRIVDTDPMVRMNRQHKQKVLLLDVGRHMPHVEKLLQALEVDYQPVPADVMLPDRAVLDTFTHCIHDDSNSEQAIEILHKAIPGCRFGVLKNIRHAMALSDADDTVLYLPLLIRNLAEFLNKSGRIPESAEISSSVLENITVRDSNILVVDDNDLNLLVSTEMLKSFQAELHSAEDGEKAIILCREQEFDLIFMDHMMPGKDGIETTREIRSDEHGLNRNTPIIALTANVVNDMADCYLQCGMNDFLSKPVAMTDLGRMLLKWLSPEKFVLRDFYCENESKVEGKTS